MKQVIAPHNVAFQMHLTKSATRGQTEPEHCTDFRHRRNSLVSSRCPIPPPSVYGAGRYFGGENCFSAAIQDGVSCWPYLSPRIFFPQHSEREAYFLILEIKPLTFIKRKCCLMKLKRKKPTPAAYQNLQHPGAKSNDPPNEIGPSFLPGCFLADHTILVPLIKGPISLIES